MRDRATSIAVPKKLLKRLHDKAGYKPLHVEIEECLTAKEILERVESSHPSLVAEARRALGAT